MSEEFQHKAIPKKAKFPKELLADTIESNNQRWIDEFYRDKGLTNSYYQSLKNFFRFIKFSNKPFSLFTLSDIYDYLEVMIENDYGVRRINGVLSFLASLKDFLIEKYPQTFSPHFLADISKIKIENPDKKYFDYKPLNLIQLSYAREFMQQDLRIEYIFEIFYQLGIQKKQFNICSLKYADQETMVFRHKDTIIHYNEKIQELLSKIGALNEFKVDYTMISFYLNRLEEYLKSKGVYDQNKTLTYSDIQKTHERFFVSCPNCGRKNEMISKNWVLTKTNLDNEYFLVCSTCKGEPVNESETN